MKLRYKSTIDEMVTAQMLWLRQTSIFKRWIYSAFIYGILAAYLIGRFSSGDPKSNWIKGIAIGCAICIVILSTYKSIVRTRLTKAMIKVFGSSSSVDAIISLENNKIGYASAGNETTFVMDNLSKMEVLEQGINLSFVRGDNFYIPNAAFSNVIEKGVWISKIKEFEAKNKQTSN